MGKLYKSRKAQVDQDVYVLDKAISVIKDMSDAKFDESVELHFNLGIDPRHADQMVRGNLMLPKGTGKEVRILCITKSQDAEQLKNAGADFVGCEDYVEKIKDGWLDIDLVLASPDAMPALSKVARILGPRGLMPSPKNGTISPKLAEAVTSFKSGKIEYRNDKTGNMHLVVGKKSFNEADLKENIVAAYQAIEKAKPASAKGLYIKTMTLCTTMGPSLNIDAQAMTVKEK